MEYCNYKFRTHLRLSAELEHGEEVEGRGAHVGESADLLGDHPELLEVDESVDVGVVGEVDEGEVLLHHRVERDDGRLHLLAVHQVTVPVLCHRLINLIYELQQLVTHTHNQFHYY